MNAPAKIEEPQASLLPADPMISMIERIAMDPNADLDKLDRMLQLKERHEANKARAAFASALARASANFPDIPLNGLGHNGKAYATLRDITAYTRPVLSENGLAMTFSIDVNDQVTVTAKLMHKDGHTETTSIQLPKENSGSKNAVQAIGSSQTYGQRYTAQAILGLSLGDDTEDDGRSSGAVPPSPPTPRTASWENTIIQDMPADATPRDKAQEIAKAICSQWGRMKGERQISNEWDRRAHLIDKMETAHPDLHETIVDAYENRRNEITEEKGAPQ